MIKKNTKYPLSFELSYLGASLDCGWVKVALDLIEHLCGKIGFPWLGQLQDHQLTELSSETVLTGEGVWRFGLHDTPAIQKAIVTHSSLVGIEAAWGVESQICSPDAANIACCVAIAISEHVGGKMRDYTGILMGESDDWFSSEEVVKMLVKQ